MGKFINGLLGEGSSVNKMAEAMQAAPRIDPRQGIDKPVASEVEKQQEVMQSQPQQGQPQQGQPAPQEELPVQKQPNPGPKTPVLSEGVDSDNEPEDISGGAQLKPPTPEEEKQARVLMANVVDFMYGDGLNTVSKSLKMPETPVPETVGQIAEELVSTQLDAAEVANQTVSSDILMSIGSEVVTHLYELAEALGVWNPGSQEQANNDMNMSLSYATNLFAERQTRTGRPDRIAGLQQMAQSVQKGEYDSTPGTPLTNQALPV